MSKQRKLVAYVHVGGEVYGPDKQPSAEVAKEITNPKAWGEGDSADDSGGGSSYTSMKVDELKAAIESRNENRDDDAQLSTEGKKAELVAVLEADDAAHS